MRKCLVAVSLGLLCAPAWCRPSVKNLVRSFEAASAEERTRMAPVLGRARDKRATEALIAVFDIKRGQPKESTAYVEALGLSEDARAIAPLAAAWDYLRSMVLQMGELTGQQQFLRWKVLEALSGVGGEQAVAILAEAVNDKDPRVAEEAVRGLGRLQVRELVPVLVQMSGSATGNLRQAVFEALGDIGDKRIVATLEHATAFPDKFVVVQASYALAKLGQKQNSARLIAMLKSDPGEEKVGLMAAYYLAKLENNKGLEHLEAIMLRPESPLAPLAAEALGKTGNPRAVLVLSEALELPSTSVRLTATRSLGHLGGSRAVSTLRKFSEDPNPGVRNSAIAALTYLGEMD
ncbi:MAG: HEAT repeat domain-containing protein [Elusimicrobiota bacterium]